MTEPQAGATYDEILRFVQHAEALGFAGFFRSDHYLSAAGDGLPGPTDAWITLAGLARETQTIRLGTLMTAATFRLPGPFAVTLAQVDQMSSGRVECGLGAGWFEGEHSAYGIPFPSRAERFDRLEEQLQILRTVWATPTGQLANFVGRHYQLAACPALPKPVQAGGIPIIVGGTGPRRTPQLAARYADEFNVAFRSAEETAEAFERVIRACREIGRDPDSLGYSAVMPIVAADSEQDLARRAAAIGQTAASLRAKGAAGTPQECADAINAYRKIGASRVYLQVLDLRDLDHLDVISERVAPLIHGHGMAVSAAGKGGE